MSVLLWAVVGVVIVRVVSFFGIAYLALKKRLLEMLLPFIVSFAVGIIFGDSFIHLLPATCAHKTPILSACFILLGIILFFMLESIVLLYQYGEAEGPCEHTRAHGIIYIVSDVTHNFLDGLIIVGSFLVSVPLGIASTIAIAMHEIPKEISDLGVLVHLGFTRMQSLWINIIAGMSALLGAVVGIILHGTIGYFEQLLISLTVGGFVYIAGSSLLPELHTRMTWRKFILQSICMLGGMVIMLIVALSE